MRVESLQVEGFRCFSGAGQSVDLGDLTCLVGPNASGKTAMMMALARVIGETQGDRTIRASDFYLDPGEKLNARQDRRLAIELRVAFPELEGDEAPATAVPEAFNQMVVDGPGGTPYSRIRLEATWTNDGTPDGEVTQRLWWVLTPSDDPEVIEANRRAVRAAERARFRVVYVPATRDPSHQIRSTTSSAFGRLLRSLDWAGKEDDVRQRLVDLRTELGQLTGVGTINASIQSAWAEIYDGRVAATVEFEGVNADPTALLDLLAPAFAPDEQGDSVSYTGLSDGLRALFALSLPLGIYQVEETLKENAAAAGFHGAAAENLPLVTMFAVEEPENHLSPHYLGKAVAQLSQISRAPAAQVVLSSHSPSIMGRVDPGDVRFFLGGEARDSTEVRNLALPMDSVEEAFKYVREAVRGHPELYFSRLVVLGEGPSEEILLSRLFEASGTPLDASFISVVPLGGRHVNHFWRLLNGLGIPYLTLLDLDLEKEGAGWGRVQYVRDQLLALHGPESDLLKFNDVNGDAQSLASEPYARLRDKDDRADRSEIDAWLALYGTQFDVFFSSPLDIDLAMLECFPDAYTQQAPDRGGPRIPEADEDRRVAAEARMRQVLAADPSSVPEDLGSTFTDDQVHLFPWYKYLFVDRSKPVAHMRALVALDNTCWVDDAPDSLKQLLERARALLTREDRGT